MKESKVDALKESADGAKWITFEILDNTKKIESLLFLGILYKYVNRCNQKFSASCSKVRDHIHIRSYFG